MTKTSRDFQAGESDAALAAGGPRGLDWQGAYQAGTTPWDLRGITAPLRRLCDDGFFANCDLPQPARVVVPMCGRGHDLRLFAELGFQVTGVDLAPAAIEEARSLQRLNGYSTELLVRDVLGLSEEFAESFDLVYDYTSFCALPTHLRRRYLAEMAGILAPAGQLLMLAFPMDPAIAGAPGQPPFLVTEADLGEAMAREFELIESFPASDSPPERKGAERWFRYRRRGQG